MKLIQIGSNQTQVTLSNDRIVFFSYQTPVAALVDGRYYRTSRKYSTTTSKHINAWIGRASAEVRDPSFFEDLAASR